MAKTIPLWKALELTSAEAYCATGQCFVRVIGGGHTAWNHPFLLPHQLGKQTYRD